jgi:hypothetical protein
MWQFMSWVEGRSIPRACNVICQLCIAASVNYRTQQLWFLGCQLQCVATQSS